MGWRQKMGGAVAIEHSRTLEQKEQKEQKVDVQGTFATSATIATKVENVKSYPIPTDEKEFARDERRAIIDVDGGPKVGTSLPVEMWIDSPILGPLILVELWPDRAEVGGVEYSDDELKDLKSRGLSVADLRAVHEVKKQFDGKVR